VPRDPIPYFSHFESRPPDFPEVLALAIRTGHTVWPREVVEQIDDDGDIEVPESGNRAQLGVTAGDG
jgi:hypothetical protein